MVNRSESDRLAGAVSLLIDYNDDLDKARALLLGLTENEAQVLKNPAPSVSFLPKPANIQVTLGFWCAPGDVSGLVAKYSEASIKVLQKEGYRLGVTSRGAA